MKKLSLLTITLVASLSIYAQKPSELRDARIYDEWFNMLSAESNVYFDQVSTDQLSDEDKDYSATILFDYSRASYGHPKSTIFSLEVYSREKILLNDKSAVEDMSELESFQIIPKSLKSDDETMVFMGVEITKPDGRVIRVPLEDYLENEASDRTYTVSYNNVVKPRKLAVKSLEVGDVIDILTVYRIRRYSATKTYIYDAVFESLTSKYPSKKGRYEILTQRGYFVNFKSMNGAPMLMKDETRSDKKNNFYFMEYEDLPRVSDEDYVDRLSEYPFIKYQVAFKPIKKDYPESFLTEPYVIKREVKLDEIHEKYFNMFKSQKVLSYTYGELKTGLSASIKIMNKALEEYKSSPSDAEKVEFAYYYFRNQILPSAEGYDAEVEEEGYYDWTPSWINYYKFMYHYLKSNEIEVEYVLTTRKSRGSLNDVAVMVDIYEGLRYNVNGEWHYIWPTGVHKTLHHFPTDLLGQKAISFKEESEGFSEFTLPEESGNNYSNLDYKLTFNFEDKQVEASIKNTSTGRFKNGRISRALWQTNWRSTDEAALKLDHAAELEYESTFVDPIVQIALYQDSIDQRLGKPSEIKGWQKEIERLKDAGDEELDSPKYTYYSEDYHDDLDVESYDGFELLKSGRFEFEDELVYTEHLVANDLIQKVGPSYVFNFGKMLPNQLQTEDKRETNVDFGYKKSYSYSFEIEIPEGYTVSGEAELEANADNAFGSFVSTVEMNGNTLIIKMTKTYKTVKIDKSEWPSVVEFLKPAEIMNTKKLVFKPS